MTVWAEWLLMTFLMATTVRSSLSSSSHADTEC